MNKKVSKILISVLIALVPIVLLISMLINSSIALTVNQATTVNQLIDCTQNSSWYDFDPSSQINKLINSGSDISFSKKGGYCVDSHGRLYRGTYKIVNIIDINNNTSSNSVKIYGVNKNGTKTENEYSFSNPNVRPFLMLAYLAEKGKNEAVVPQNYMNYSYKAAMTGVFLNQTYVNQMRQVGLSDYLIPSHYYDYLGWRLFKEARVEAEKIAKQGNIATATISDKTNKDNITSFSNNGKFFVGPYKLSLTNGGKVGEILINGNISAAGISTDGKTVTSVESVVDEKEFYVVLNNEVSNIQSIKAIGKEQVGSIKARLLFVSGGANQNFHIYKAESTPQKPSVDLPVPSFATLQIIKKDKSGKNLNLKDIGFVVWSQSKNSYVIVKNGNIEYVDFETAKKNEFKTDKNGKTQTISKLPAGKYEIYETSIPDTLKEIYDLPEITLKDKDSKTVRTNAKLVKENGKDYAYVQLKSGQTVTLTAVNTRAFANFYIDKKDNKTGQALNGIEFKLYNVKEKGWVKFDKNNVTTSVKETFENASVMVTGISGTPGLTQTIKKLPVGEYTIYETGLGEYEDIYELGTFKLSNKTYKGKEIVTKTLSADETGDAYYILDKKGNAYYEAGNTQTYISISGIVWEDTLQDKNNKTRNDILDEDDNRINGIIVKLMDKTTGKVVTREDGREQATKTYYNADTKQNGYYKFDKVKIEKLSDYYVEFEYDGITYQNVITPEKSTDKLKLTDLNTSKANETSSVRNSLNNAFKELTGEGQIINYNNKNIKVTYNKEKNGDDIKVIPNEISDREKALDEQNKVVNLSKSGEFTVNSITEQNYLKNKYDALTEKSKIITEIENVNLGLYVREQPNVSIVKDVQKADVTINGKAYTYKYERRIAENAIPTTVGVIFERKDQLSDGLKYKTPVYRADALYETDDKSKELNVYITYTVGLVNNSVTLSTKVNELREIYSKELEFVKMSTLEGNDEKILINQVQEQLNGNYKTYTFKDLNVQVEAQTTKYLYLTFKLPREQIYNVIQNNINTGKEYMNFVEIGSYTVYSDKFNSLYAGFDYSSIPNNLDVNKYDETDEDDSDKAPGLYIQDAGERTLSGMVFEDNDKDENDNERIGDGKYVDGENKISNVKVRLIDNNGNEVQVYDLNKKQFVNQTSVTNEKGEYTISGFIPGDYKVQYTWGEGENTVIKNGSDRAVTVDSYKSTIWTEESKQEKQDAKWFMQKDVRYSDAQDNYEERIRLDENNASLLDTLKKPVNDVNAVSNKAVMKSITPEIAVGIETGEYEEVLTDNTPIYKFNIVNVDLGLIERPRLTMNIKKSVDSVKLLTDQKQVILDAKVNNEGKLEVTAGSVTGGPEYGYIRGEVDTDIINSATVAQVGYKVVITNTSEQDYDSKDYYLYGTDKDNNKLVILKAEGIYDYLGGLETSVDLNNDWKVLQNGSDETKVETVTQLMAERMENTISSALWYESNKETGTTKLVQETFSNSVQEIIKEYVEDKQSTVKEFKNLIKENKVISKLAENAIELKAGESKEFKYYGETTLSTGKDIRFENDVEIANVTKNKNRGRSVVLEHSNLYDRAEWVTITPPTGENKDYTSIIIISIASIAILGAGILVIKKVVLK